jgi:ATP-dependent Clp protease ATP-binding subunit ClpB
LAIEMGGQLKRLENRLAERRVSLVVTDAACRLLAQRGWDPMAMMLLEGKFSDGDTITVDVRGAEIAFRASAATPADAAS